MHDAVGDASDNQPVHAAAAVGRQQNQVHFFLLSQLQNGRRRP